MHSRQSLASENLGGTLLCQELDVDKNLNENCQGKQGIDAGWQLAE